MKTRFRLAWLVFGIVLTISPLAAQDVTVTDPAWLDPENPPAEQQPLFKKRPKFAIPDGVKKTEQLAYAIVWQDIDEKGEILSWMPFCTNPHLQKALEGGIKFSPAMQRGKGVSVSCWFGVILNPGSASLKRDDAIPRLLAVAPVLIGKKDFPLKSETSSVIWAMVTLDEKGLPKNFVFDESAHEVVRKQVDDSLRRWKFAPARRGCESGAGELHVPFILMQAGGPESAVVQPRVVLKEVPVYPEAMKGLGLDGEVLVEFIVDESGAVTNPVVVQSNNPGFNDAALKALMKWKYKPGRKNGKLVAARMKQPFVFDYEGPGKHDFGALEPSSQKQQAKLPAEFRYDVAPTLKGVQMPVYPFQLLRDEIYGRASVVYIIDAEGCVVDVKVVEASKPEFGAALAAAAETFRYVPAMRDGKPTQTLLRMDQTFTSSHFSSVAAEKDEDLIQLEKRNPEKILVPKKLDSPVKVITQRPPVFPLSVLNRQTQGLAKLEFLIDEEGCVRLPRVVIATDPAFGYAAVQAIAAWRFEPPKAGGKPVVVRVRLPFEFNVETENTEAEVTKP